MDTLLSSTSITFERMVLVVFNSEGRRDVPLVSVATVSSVVREALCSKISAVVLFEENISSACKNELPQQQHQCHKAEIHRMVTEYKYNYGYNNCCRKWHLTR